MYRYLAGDLSIIIYARGITLRVYILRGWNLKHCIILHLADQFQYQTPSSFNPLTVIGDYIRQRK